MSDTAQLDTEGFEIVPRPPLRLADLPAAFEAVAAEEPAPEAEWEWSPRLAKIRRMVREFNRVEDSPEPAEVATPEAKPVLPWWFGTLDPVQQGGRR